jgi:hypothetical protein
LPSSGNGLSLLKPRGGDLLAMLFIGVYAKLKPRGEALRGMKTMGIITGWDVKFTFLKHVHSTRKDNVDTGREN